MDITNSNLTGKSIVQAVYNQLDYVIRHFTNQGKNTSSVEIRYQLLKCDYFQFKKEAPELTLELGLLLKF